MYIDFCVLYNNIEYFIEYDGIQHFEYQPYLHLTAENFEKELRRDRVLESYCYIHRDKIILLRFTYKQTKEEITNKLKEIFN